LVIDDESQLRKVLSRIIELEGFEVLQAENASAGLKLIAEHRDLLTVVCDVRLPDYSGMKLLEKIKKGGYLCEVIMLTVYGTISEGVFAMKQGSFDYLLFAQSIHTASSRNKKPFIAVNCSALPHDLLESEIFGHVKGSFTGAIADKKGLFEEADEGTLFLDEIGEMHPDLQVKLLRVLEEKTITRIGSSKSRRVDVRIIAATNRDLSA
jgi:DNA-binding NtrC family response regulator